MSHTPRGRFRACQGGGTLSPSCRESGDHDRGSKCSELQLSGCGDPYHYTDARDDIDYIAAFSRTGISELHAASEGRKVEAIPIVVAASRREELHTEIWKVSAFCFVLWVVSLILAGFFVRSLWLHDAAKIRGGSANRRF